MSSNEKSISSMADNSVPVKDSSFICGVVEGFYGRPWTSEQRKDLFQKMKKWGMDCYLYAPKDDYKHRTCWRELYTVEEADNLTGLISTAKENDITFYYALSPGLDITYSSVKEITALKRKLEQVSQFGCVAFALLYDDIEPEMCEADKEVFQSFAHAQVTITNDVVQHLNRPKFMVCPTQYCATRANPDVKNSEYLATLGSKLAPDIDIMWTGGKVISRLITPEDIDELAEVLKRRPVIWDNIHANDYDQKRIFLGPYQGRTPDIIPKLRGVVTNPNCEYGANFIAIHTLSQWIRCNTDGSPDNILNDSISADIKLETECEDGISEDISLTLPTTMYYPRRALRNAIREWLEEFKKPKQAWGPIQKPQPAVSIPLPLPISLLTSINTCMTLTTNTTTCSTVNSCITTATTTTSSNSPQLQALADACNMNSPIMSSMQQPASSPMIMNSLVSDTKVISEPMDCNPTPADSSPQSPLHSSKTNDDCMADNLSTTSSMNVESPSPNSIMQIDSVSSENSEGDVTYEDLILLCDLFYLPFEHGSQGLQILNEFNWLKCNAHLVSSANLNKCTRSATTEKSPEVQEWRERARKMEEMGNMIDKLFKRLCACNNRELLHELYPYVWDIRGIISLLNSFIRWLGDGHFPSTVANYTVGNYTWFSKGWKESFMSGDQEPWVFRGGLIADLQRLFPVDSGIDLFAYKAPEVVVSTIYTVRPYRLSDEEAVYELCRKSFFDGDDASLEFVEYPDLPGDRTAGPFLTLYPEYCFVVEDEVGIIGYAAAATSAKQYYSNLKNVWIPELASKYPRNDCKDIADKVTSHQQALINWIHSYEAETVPSSISAQYPSILCSSVLPIVTDQAVSKRLIVCLLAALRANGSLGVHVPVDSSNKYTMEFYNKMGFLSLLQNYDPDTVYYGRTF